MEFNYIKLEKKPIHKKSNDRSNPIGTSTDLCGAHEEGCPTGKAAHAHRADISCENIHDPTQP